LSTPADPYRFWDVAYMLGSLAPAERREFEHHLGECAACTSNVSALAGIPGILSAVPNEHALEMMTPDPVLPRRPRPARPSRLWARVRFTAALIGSAAAGVAVGMVIQPEALRYRRRASHSGVMTGEWIGRTTR
jgi:anti-sigma factor RsiW